MYKKKYWMTLLELIMVIWILAIIVAIIVPNFSNSKTKSRDILRKSQVQEIWAAIVSYWMDHGWFPISSGTCISELSTELISWWYLKQIDTDPNNEMINTECDREFSICTWWYYNYVSNWSRFVLAAYMENIENWNYICLNPDTNCTNGADTNHLCHDLEILWSSWDLAQFLDGSYRLNDSNESHIYIYLYQ